MGPYLMQVVGSATILLIDVQDGVLHGVLGGGDDCVRGQIHCSVSKSSHTLHVPHMGQRQS